MKGNNNVKRLTKPEVVVITGASAGLGRATARAFAIEGAHIGLLAVWLNQTAATTCGSLCRETTAHTESSTNAQARRVRSSGRT